MNELKYYNIEKFLLQVIFDLCILYKLLHIITINDNHQLTQRSNVFKRNKTHLSFTPKVSTKSPSPCIIDH